MPRPSNIFHNVVTNEDSTTELFCNLLRFAAFRYAFLKLFLSDELISNITWEDIDTQFDLSGSGRADLVIQSGDVSALVEIKTTYGRALTENQPAGYLQYLSRSAARETWLVFLVPGKWSHRQELNDRLHSASAHAPRVNTKLITWEEVMGIIEDNDFRLLSPVVNDFSGLIASRIAPTPVVFTKKEVLVLFSNEIPAALSKLRKLVDDIQVLCTSYNVRPSKNKDEYGFYMFDADGKEVFWFGLWLSFWERHGTPLSFGVAERWPSNARTSFATAYKGATKQFDKFVAGSVPQECFASDDPVDAVWQRVRPIMDAIKTATEKGIGAKA